MSTASGWEIDSESPIQGHAQTSPQSSSQWEIESEAPVVAPKVSATKDPLDWSDYYNTPLSPAEKPKFDAWKEKYAPNDKGYDYDYQGAFKAGITPDTNRGHWSDQFKKPNHPTFSDESQYNGHEGYVGGHWGTDGTYTPSVTNLKLRTPEELQKYFHDNEPDTKLNLPGTVQVGSVPILPEEPRPKYALTPKGPAFLTPLNPEQSKAITDKAYAHQDINIGDVAPLREAADQLADLLPGPFFALHRAAIKTAGASLTPNNVGTILLAGPVISAAAKIPAAAPALRVLMGTYFGSQAGKQFLAASEKRQEDWKKRDYQALADDLSQETVAATFAGLGAKEAARAGKVDIAAHNAEAARLIEKDVAGAPPVQPEAANPTIGPESTRIKVGDAELALNQAGTAPDGRPFYNVVDPDTGKVKFGGYGQAVGDWLKMNGAKPGAIPEYLLPTTEPAPIVEQAPGLPRAPSSVEAPSPQAPSPAEPQPPPVAEPAAASAREPRSPEPPAPPAGELTVGQEFEKPEGTYRVKAVDNGKVTYDFENKAGQKITFSKPTSLFQKIIANAQAPAPQTPAPPPVEKPTEAPAPPVAGPVAPGWEVASQEPIAPVQSPDAGQTPIPAENKPVIPASGAEIQGTPEIPLVTEVAKPGTEAPPQNATEESDQRLAEAEKQRAEAGPTNYKPQPIEEPQENSPEPISANAEKSIEAEKPTYHSTQVNLHPDVAQKVVDFGKQIPDNKLAEDGRETEPHITLQYGIGKETPFEQVAKSLEGQGPITAKLGTMSVFKTPEYDVLKVDVSSPDLHAAKGKVLEGTQATETHPTYQPHVTIAYLKPGEGAKYVGKPLPNVTGKTLTFNSVMFSPKGGEQQAIPLAKGPGAGQNVAPVRPLTPQVSSPASPKEPIKPEAVDHEALPKSTELIIPNKDAKKIISDLKTAIDKGIKIPIVQNVAIITSGGKTKLVTTDLETAVTYTLTGIAKGDGAITIPLSSIENALKAKSKDDLKISSDEKKAKVSVGGSEIGAEALPISSYPEIPVPNERVGFIPAPALLNAIRSTIAAISKEESRFTLNAGLLEIGNGKGKIVTTDGHRMAISEFDAPGVTNTQKPLLIRRSALEALVKVFDKEPGDVVLKLKRTGDQNEFIYFDTSDGKVRVSARRMEGNFPDYQRVMPDESTYTNKAVVDRKALSELMQNSGAAKTRSGAIKLSFRNGQLFALVDQSDVNSKGTIPATLEGLGKRKDDPGNPRLSLDARYLLDFTKSTDAPQVEITIKDNGKEGNAIIARSVGEPSSTTIIMPMRDSAIDYDDGMGIGKEVEPEPDEEKSGERGAAPMLTDIPKWVADQFKPEEGPKLNYSWLGAKKRVILPGRQLKEVEEASREEVFPAAARAGSSASQASVILQQGAPAVRKALQGSDVGFDEMRLALIESNLRGKRERWLDFANQAAGWSDDEIEKAIAPNPDGTPSFYLDLLSNIEGRQGIAQDLGETATALAETKDWDVLRQLMTSTFNDAAGRVATAMDPAWFDDVHDKLTNNVHGKEALKQFDELIAKPIADNHAINEGVFSNAYGPLGTYYPLIALGRKTMNAPGRRLAYRKPQNPSNYFATGLSDAYDPTMTALADKISQNLRANDKAALIQTMKDSKWLVPESKAFQTPDGKLAMIAPDGEEYLAVRKETSAARTIVKDGKPIRIGAQFNVMPKFMETGLGLILERGPMEPNDVAAAMRWANTLATKGPLELIYHSTGVLGSMYANTPFLGKSELDKALSLPLIKWFGIRAKLFNVDPMSPENVKKLQRLAKVGALPAKSGRFTYSKQYAEDTGAKLERFSFSPMLYGPKGVDVRARILMHDIFEAFNPNGSDADLHDFVNQIGNYTPEFQGAIERALKHSGFGTFATAGMTRLVNSGQAYSGGPTWNQGDWKARAAWLMMASAWAAVAIWLVTHKVLTGKNPDKRARFNDIPVGSGNGYIDKYRHSVPGNALWGSGPGIGHINLSYFNNPLSLRGARMLGLSGAFEANQLGGKPWQMFEAANKDVLNALSGPALGPAAKALFVMGTGAEPSVTGFRDSITGRPSLQFYPAVPRGVKPGLPTYGARAFAAAKELNSFYIDSGEHLGELTGLFAPSKGIDKGNWFAQTAFQLAFPGLFGAANNPYAKSEMLRKQRNAANR